MNVKILQLAEGAKQAEGFTVIIDVFRAFTLEAYLFAQGSEEILAVYDMNTALLLKKEHPSYLLAGERHGAQLPGFDFGNSPYAIKDKDFTGKHIIHTTSNGTLGIANAIHADTIMVGSFVNAKAIAQCILRQNPNEVSLVAMGWEGRSTEEDTLCGEYIRSLLLHQPIQDIDQKIDGLRYTEGKKFFDPQQQNVFPQGDFEMCVQRDLFDFVIHTEVKDGVAYNTKESL